MLDRFLYGQHRVTASEAFRPDPEERGGNRGIYLEPLQQNRNERAREAGDEEIAGHREEHNEPQLSTPSHRDGHDRYRNPDRKPIDQPDENLLSHYPKKAVRR